MSCGRIFLFFLILLVVKSGGTSSCVLRDDTAPTFAPSSSSSNTAFVNDQLILVPSLSFSCAGRLTSWQAYMERSVNYGSISFQVWRHLPGTNCSYQLIGSQTVNNYRPDSDLLVNTSTLSTTLTPVFVLPGDIVAAYVSASSRRRVNFQTYPNYSPTMATYKLSIPSSDLPSKATFSCAEAGVTTEASVPIITATIEVTTPPPSTIMSPSVMTRPVTSIATSPPTSVTSSVTAATSLMTPLQTSTTELSQTTATGSLVTQEATSSTSDRESQPLTLLPTDSTDSAASDQQPEISTENIGLSSTDPSGLDDKKLQNEQTTESPQGVLDNIKFYLAIGVAAALFVVLSLACCVITCWCLVRRRRIYKASLRSFPGSHIYGKNVYYEDKCHELQVPDKLELNDYDLDQHIYDTVDQLEEPKKKKKKKDDGLKGSFRTSMLTTPEASAEFSMASGQSGKFAVTTQWPRSKCNDYEDHMVGHVPRPGWSNRADPAMSMQCSDYEVPRSTIPRNETKRTAPEPADYSVPINQAVRSPNSQATAESDFAANHYEIPCSSIAPATTKSNLKSSDYSIPCDSARMASKPAGMSQRGGHPPAQVKLDSEYDQPCPPRMSQRIKSSQKEGKNEEEEDDYTSMDAVWNQ